MNSINTGWVNFFRNFNYMGKITEVPDSFKRPRFNATNANRANNFTNAFNSTGYTINQNATGLINLGATPNSDRNTFSDNQPGLCDIAANWKVTNTSCTPNLNLKNIQLTVVTTGANQTVRLNKYFANAHRVFR